MSNKRVIGVLTSGGDAPGMNAAIRAVVRKGIKEGFTVMGIQRGYNGLILGEMYEMGLRDVSDVIQRGGTILGTARCKEFRDDPGIEKGKQRCLDAGICGLVVIGGDGSFRGASDLSKKGIPCIGIPGTIDNDITCTDYTIGYDTCMNTVVEMVDRLRDTAQSHERCSVVEVMGRRAGHIALNAGVACGASAILISEKDHSDAALDRIADKIKFSLEIGKKHFIILVSEGVGHVDEIAAYIQEKTGVESRGTVLGHVQRGGSPSLRDRVIASQMGHYAVELLMKGESDRVVAYKNGTVCDYDIQEALQMQKTIEEDVYKVMNDISF